MRIRFISILALLFCVSCNKDFKSEKDTPIGVFNAMWQFIDENYVFVDYKNLDMEQLKNTYSMQISENSTDDELFEVCSNLLFELQDGHCFLNNGNTIARFDTADGFDTQFDPQVIEENYVQGNVQKLEYVTIVTINDSTGYIHLSEFKNVEEIREAITAFNQLSSNYNKIIFDIRDNSGGSPAVALTTASSFMERDILLGQMIHKDGKAHNDFTAPVDILSEGLPLRYEEQVRLLTNRKSYSASSFLAGMLQYRDNVKIIGESTGGGGGDVISNELPNGWVVAVTVNFFLDAMGNHIENGVMPDVTIINTADEIASGIDSVLEEAITN